MCCSAGSGRPPSVSTFLRRPPFLGRGSPLGALLPCPAPQGFAGSDPRVLAWPFRLSSRRAEGRRLGGGRERWPARRTDMQWPPGPLWTHCGVQWLPGTSSVVPPWASGEEATLLGVGVSTDRFTWSLQPPVSCAWAPGSVSTSENGTQPLGVRGGASVCTQQSIGSGPRCAHILWEHR